MNINPLSTLRESALSTVPKISIPSISTVSTPPSISKVSTFPGYSSIPQNINPDNVFQSLDSTLLLPPYLIHIILLILFICGLSICLLFVYHFLSSSQYNSINNNNNNNNNCNKCCNDNCCNKKCSNKKKKKIN